MARTKLTPAQLVAGEATASQNTSSTTASVSYGNLADAVTTSVTVTIGANGQALISFAGILSNSGGVAIMAVAISGATTVAGDDFKSLQEPSTAARGMGYTYLKTGLTPGSTTFTLVYRVNTGTGTFNGRNISVIPL